MLALLASRILYAFGKKFVTGEALLAVVTSDEPANREFEKFSPMGLRVFYGSKENIPFRHLQAARALDVDAIVAVDGDDILCSIEAMQVVLDDLESGRDYVKTSGLPLGMNAFGYQHKFLSDSLIGNEDKTLETGWGYIFDSAKLTDRLLQLELNEPKSLRFTLDYPEDYEFFKAIMEGLGQDIVSSSDEEIVTYVLAHGLEKLTEPVAEKYWDNFRVVQADEMGREKKSGGA